MDTQKSNKPESASFETIQPEKDNPAHKEFEIGQLENEKLKEDELICKTALKTMFLVIK